MKTTVNNLTIEQMREIVEGAPDNTALYYSNEDGDLVYFRDGDYYDNDYGDWFEIYFMMPDLILLNTLRIAIDEYDSREFEVNDQVVLINKPGSSNSIHRVLEVRHPTTIVVCPINQISGNDLVVLQFCASPYYLRHITGDEFDAGYRIDEGAQQ